MRPLCLWYTLCLFVMATATCLPPLQPTDLTKSTKTAAGNHGGHPHTPRAARASIDGHERRSNGWAQQPTQHRQKTRTQDQSSNSPATSRTGKRRQFNERQNNRGAADTSKEQTSLHSRSKYAVLLFIVYIHCFLAVSGGLIIVVIVEEVVQATGKHTISCKKIRERLGRG